MLLSRLFAQQGGYTQQTAWRILVVMTKLYFAAGVVGLLMSPTLALAQDPRTDVEAAEAASGNFMVSSMSVEDLHPRPYTALRDLLRQPPDKMPSKQPYRLSPEERQRLREQLRQQAAPAQPQR